MIRRGHMKTTDESYMDLHLVWRADITGNEDIEIDESVFEEIYQLQEEQDEQVHSSHRERIFRYTTL